MIKSTADLTPQTHMPQCTQASAVCSTGVTTDEGPPTPCLAAPGQSHSTPQYLLSVLSPHLLFTSSPAASVAPAQLPKPPAPTHTSSNPLFANQHSQERAEPASSALSAPHTRLHGHHSRGTCCVPSATFYPLTSNAHMRSLFLPGLILKV